VLEAFGGAGYVEDTGLPALLRDSQVLPIWEGTTNVLSLDTLRALGHGAGWAALKGKIADCVDSVRDPRLAEAGHAAQTAVTHAERWLAAAAQAGQPMLEMGARRFAMTLGRALELALLIEHAQWSLDHEQDGRARAAGLRFACTAIDLIVDVDEADTYALANDTAIPIS
jgi:acyl-CoA dehydrogenase